MTLNLKYDGQVPGVMFRYSNASDFETWEPLHTFVLLVPHPPWVALGKPESITVEVTS